MKPHRLIHFDLLTFVAQSYLVRKNLVQFVAVILESHSAVGLHISHVYALVQVHHKLALRVNLHRNTIAEQYNGDVTAQWQ